MTRLPSKTPALFWLALGCVLLLGVRTGDALEPEDFFGNPDLVQGDLDAVARHWLDLLRRAPDSEEAQAALLLWDTVLDGTTRVPDADDWQGIRDALETNGWTDRLVGWRLQRARLAAGKREPASAVGLLTGNPRAWVGIGPFGKTRAIDLYRPFPPETVFDAKASYDGSEHPVVWRPLSMSTADTRLYPRAEWTRRGSCYYLRARFRSQDAGRDGLILHSTCGGSYRIWIDGTQVTSIDRRRNAHAAVTHTGIRLQPGTHTILVKCDGASVAVLFRRPDGFPFPIEDLDPMLAGEDAGARPDPDVEPVGLVRRDWGARWRARSLNPVYRPTLAVLLAQAGNAADARRVLDDCEAAGDPWTTALAATWAAPSLRYLPGDWKKNWLAELWTLGLEEHPDGVLLKQARAAQWAADGKNLEAVALIGEILAAQPRSLHTHVLRYEICSNQNWEREAHDALRGMREAAPAHPRVVNYWVAHWVSYARLPARATVLREQLFAQEPNLSSARSLARSRAAIGRVDEALALFDEVQAIEGPTIALLRARAALLEDYDRTDEAIELIQRLEQRVPDDVRLVERRAALLWGEGRSDEALAALAHALSLDPGRMDLLRRLRFLEDQRAGRPFVEDHFWTPYAIDADAAIAAAPPLDRYPEAAAVYLVDQIVSRYHRDGGVEEMTHQVIRIDSAQAVRQFSNLTVPGEVLELRVLTPDGRELHPTAGGGRGRYTLPGLEPGSIVEYRSILRRDLAGPEDASFGPFYFRDPDFQDAFHHTEAVLLYPSEWQPRIRERQLPTPGTERRIDGYVERRWSYQEMDRRQPEVRMPPIGRVLPNVVWSAHSEWDEVTDSVAARAVRRDFPTPELEDAVSELLDGVSGRRDRVEALHTAVCDRVKTRGASPNATVVWMQRRGDRDLLLAGLLRTARIPFQWVYVARNDDVAPFTDWSVPNASNFWYSLIRVPLEDGSYLHVSTSQRLAAPGRVPQAIQGGRAIIAHADHGEWTVLPRGDLSEDASYLELDIDLSSGAHPARVSGHLEDHRLSRNRNRERLQTVNDFQRRVIIERYTQALLPTARVVSGDFPRLEERGEPFCIEFEVESDTLVQSQGERTMLKAVVDLTHMKRRFASRGERTLPYVSSAQSLRVTNTRIELGDRFRLRRLPEDLQLSGPWGSYQLTYRQHGTRVTVERRLHLRPFWLEPEDYELLLETCSQIDRKEEERITLEES